VKVAIYDENGTLDRTVAIRGDWKPEDDLFPGETYKQVAEDFSLNDDSMVEKYRALVHAHVGDTPDIAAAQTIDALEAIMRDHNENQEQP